MSTPTTPPTSPASATSGPPGASGGGMHFYVDSWDPGYGSSVEVGSDALPDTTAAIDAAVEAPPEDWEPVPVPASGMVTEPEAVLFIDGVRRIDARVWIDTPGVGTGSSMGLCASYASGVICCCEGEGAHLLESNVRRGLFSTVASARDIDAAPAGIYSASLTPEDPTRTPASVLSDAVQRRLSELEVLSGANARHLLTGHGLGAGTDLLVIDGPLRGRPTLARAVGLVKSHQTAYLPDDLNAAVAALGAGQRSPVFMLGTNWERYSWYLRLPCRPGPPWNGIVRIECATDMTVPAAIELANLTQFVLPTYASQEYKDTRAPQNLVPIAGLESELRRRLGDARLVSRSLRTAAAIS